MSGCEVLEEELIPLDPACPWCGASHDVDEVFDGSERRCGNCGRRIVAVEWTDGTMSMVRIERGSWRLTGRARTRALRRKRGRR